MGYKIGPDGKALDSSQYVLVAASQTTKQISPAGNAQERGDFLAGVSVIWASTLGGTVTLIDGTTTFMVIPAQVTAATDIVPRYVELGITATSTKGFNITTGASVSCLAIGRFG
jgi:hypothetical protein